MQRHLLVTVSCDSSALNAVRFVAGFFQDKAGLKLTLFHTRSKAFDADMGDSHEKRQDAMRMADKLKCDAENALNQAEAQLLELGFSPENMERKIVPRQYTLAGDIIRESDSGLYDAIILGRRGVGWLEEALGGSVSRELLDKRFSCPFWLCRRADPERQDVLLCVDGSPASMRMVDHAGFMLSQEPRHDVVLLKVGDEETPGGLGTDQVMAESREALVQNGVDQERITFLVKDQGDVAKAVLKEADLGDYAAVGVGRSSVERGLLARLFTDSVSMDLFRDLSGPCLWISH
ncbi:MAG: universal stress protein [Desulfovibrio sp.]|nr:MAG: universal stress protein [Desulfovibrio sp.]